MTSVAQAFIPVSAMGSPFETGPERGKGAGTGGFEGSVTNLTLSDVIQLEGRNLFSGSILVSYQDVEGQIFFQGGQVVHAELGKITGEEAFNWILSWPGGKFKLHPNVSSLQRTIEKNLDHLLLSSHQWLDELRHRHSVTREVPVMPGPSSRKEVTHTICEVPGVISAVLSDREGVCRESSGARVKDVAAKGLYLADMIAKPVGECLGLGELKVATMHGGPEPVLLFKAKELLLSVGFNPEASAELVEQNIRRSLAAQKAGH